MWLKRIGYSDNTIRKVVSKLIKLVHENGAFIDLCLDDIREMYWDCTKYIRHSFVYAWDCFSRFLISAKIDYIMSEFRKWLINKGYSEATAYYCSCKIKTLVRRFNSFCFNDDDIRRKFEKCSGKTRRTYLYSFRRFKEFVRELGYVVVIDNGRYTECC